MKKIAFFVVSILAIVLIEASSASARKVHDFACTFCHLSYNREEVSFMTFNVCLDCHYPGNEGATYPLLDGSDSNPITATFAAGDGSNAMGSNISPGSETSHFFAGSSDNQPAAGATPPGDSRFNSGWAFGQVTCSRCHNPHAEDSNPKLLKMGGASADDMCIECHGAWNKSGNRGRGSHPMHADYPAVAAANPEKFKPAPDNFGTNGNISLVDGVKVSCTSCHGVHWTDSDATTVDGKVHPLGFGDGKLLKFDGPKRENPDQSLCQTCHAYEQHGGDSGLGCMVCHTGHEYDTDGNPNYYVLKEQVFLDLVPKTGQPGTVNIDYTFFPTEVEGICLECHDLPNNHDSGDLGHFGSCGTCHQHGSGFRASCSDCHGNSDTGAAHPDGLANNINTNYAWADDAGSHSRHVSLLGNISSCYLCHPMPEGGTSHLNGAIDIVENSFSYVDNNQTCNNISCHGNTAAEWGAAACLDCHMAVQGNRVAVTGQFNGNSHHVQGVNLSSTQCYQCHWEANSDGTIAALYHGGVGASAAMIDLVIYGDETRPTDNIPGTTSIQYTADGSRREITKLNDHCLSCHSDRNSAIQPFADGKTPQEYAWDNLSIESRYNQRGTTSFGKYIEVANAAQKIQTKSFSAHGHATENQGGWSPTTGVDGTLPNTRDGAVNVACFDCHNSHGSNISGITTSYASATTNGGILKDTQSGRGGYFVTYQPVAGGAAAQKNVRNPGASLCVDCHTAPNGGTTQPWGYKAPFGATEAIIGYFDKPWDGSGEAGTIQRFPYKNQQSWAGGHFGASLPLASETMGSINGLCTPCHDPHGVSPSLGVDQAYGVPLLKGTWLTSPYKEDIAPSQPLSTRSYSLSPFKIDQNTFGLNIQSLVSGIDETELQFAGLCLKCHPKKSLTDGVTHTWKSKDRIHESVKGWKTAPTTVKHTFACSKCHSPHQSSALPRLMVTNCLDPFQKGQETQKSKVIINGVDDWGATTGHIPSGNSGRCHQSAIGASYFGMDQSWNSLTPWNNDPSPSIIAGPSANPYSFTYDGYWYFEAGINWSTDVLSTGTVEWGKTSSYGHSYGRGLSKQHSIPIWPLENHTTYHYRVRSKNNLGQEVISEDRTFTMSVPPTVPALQAEPDVVSTGDCLVTLAWYGSDYPGGGTIEYEVQLDDAADFSSPLPSAGWDTLTTYSSTVTTGKTWYWRVRARESSHPTVMSAWSSKDAFRVLSATPPPAPTLVPEPDFESNCISQVVTVEWNPVSSPDGDAVHYYVNAGFTNSGWLTQGETSWSFSVPAGLGVSWKVIARDAGHPDATSTSANDTFTSICWTSSCPLVFGWNGTEFDYITDIAGPILGLPSMKSSRDVTLFQPEVVVLEGLESDSEGRFRVRIHESLPEIAYLDSTRLLAVDHPEGYEIHTSGAETTYIYGYANPFRIYTAKNALSPVAAFTSDGRDILETIMEVDNVPAPLDPFDSDFYYTIDFGRVQRPQFAKLLIDGWTLYGLPALTADQLIQPYVEVVDPNGEWVRVKSIGTPAGDLKTMVVDMANAFLSNDHRIRIHTGMRRASRWLIDRIRLDQSAPVDVTVQEVPLAAADLQFGGNAIEGMSTLDSRIIANDINLPVNENSPSYGSFTRYGDVTALLSSSDDKYAIMREGDRVELIFPANELLKEGIERTLIIEADLYYKSLVVSNKVEPLPFHGMSEYPYSDPESYPFDAEHKQYLEEYNTRTYE